MVDMATPTVLVRCSEIILRIDSFVSVPLEGPILFSVMDNTIGLNVLSQCDILCSHYCAAFFFCGGNHWFCLTNLIFLCCPKGFSMEKEFHPHTRVTQRGPIASTKCYSKKTSGELQNRECSWQSSMGFGTTML